MEQNNNEKKQLVKVGAKIALKAATAPIKTMIMGAVAAVLPYILVGMLVFVVIFCVYFGTLEQIDEIFDGSEEWGERMGNLFSLHGFKTSEELEKDEETKFFKMLSLYKEVFRFNDYEISLITETLLYEGSSEERIYLSEYKDREISTGTTDGPTNMPSFWEFLKNIVTNYQRGFATSFAGASQYLKANKSMIVNAAALRKCKNLTDNQSDEEKCYRGYLIADYNFVTDYFIDCNYSGGIFCGLGEAIESDVEPGFLILPNNLLGETVAGTNEIYDIRNAIIEQLTKFSIFKNARDDYLKFEENMRDSLNLYLLGELAGKDDLHFYYDGYIVNNLKEEYKIYNNLEYENSDEDILDYLLDDRIKELFEKYDKETIELERKNRRKVADMISDLTYTYFELTSGLDKIEELFTEIVASNESNASVIIDSDGNSISFDDYVLIYALAKYGEQIKEIVDSGQNVDERLRALMIIARTQIYDETGFNHSSAEVNGDNDIYELGKEIYDSFKEDSNLYKYLANLSTSIAGSRGKTIKVNGQVITLSPEQIDQVLDAVQNGGTIEDAITTIIPDSSLNTTFFPLPEGSFRVSSEYGEIRENETHNAIDYAAPKGTKIYSISDGVIADVVNYCTVGDADCGGGFGNRVYVKYSTGDGHDYYVIYAHMSSTSNLTIGQQISAGTLLGQVGNTGSVWPFPSNENPNAGSHLHLEVRKDNAGSSIYAVNPSTIFDINFGG